MSESEGSARRSTHVEHDVVYAEVGASAAVDLQRFPPEGTSPFLHELKLGSGADRFLVATNTLMTWGAQRAAGIEVTVLSDDAESHYVGVTFDADGVPEPAPETEVRYGPDGEAFLTAGNTAELKWPARDVARQVRVVYVVDEVRRAGFALGTADAEGVIGETAMLIEHREDDSVWAVARGFYSAPVNGFLGLKGRSLIRLAEKTVLEQLAALAPGVALGNNPEGE